MDICMILYIPHDYIIEFVEQKHRYKTEYVE